MECGMPQGSCLGPILFAMCSVGSFSKLISGVHCYADDTQVYISFSPNLTLDQLSHGKLLIGSWYRIFVCGCLMNNLNLNDDKTGFLIIGTTARKGWHHENPRGQRRHSLDDGMNPKPNKKLSLGAESYGTIAWKGFFTKSQVLLSSIVIKWYATGKRFQNACARLIFKERKFSHITPLLQSYTGYQ